MLRAPWLLPAPWSSAFLQEAAGFLLTLGFFFLCPEEWFFFFFFNVKIKIKLRGGEASHHNSFLL